MAQKMPGSHAMRLIGLTVGDCGLRTVELCWDPKARGLVVLLIAWMPAGSCKQNSHVCIRVWGSYQVSTKSLSCRAFAWSPLTDKEYGFIGALWSFAGLLGTCEVLTVRFLEMRSLSMPETPQAPSMQETSRRFLAPLSRKASFAQHVPCWALAGMRREWRSVLCCDLESLISLWKNYRPSWVQSTHKAQLRRRTCNDFDIFTVSLGGVICCRGHVFWGIMCRVWTTAVLEPCAQLFRATSAMYIYF